MTASVMEVASNALRGLIVAPPGRKLCVADLSNIEGRVLAWLAGEQWKLDAFKAFDAGTGPDLYKLAYARAFRIRHEDVTKPQRQIGKVMELALGYGGGVGAFVTMAAGYGMDLDELARSATPNIPEPTLEEAGGAYRWAEEQGRTQGLAPGVYVACDALKRLWRAAHPKTAELWSALEWGYRATVGEVTLSDDLPKVPELMQLDKVGAWLRIRLPSGRYLCYPSPRVGDDGKLSYMGVGQYTRKWERIHTYGGKLSENVTQAVARDVMAAAMPHAEAAGYELVLSVHDELVAETPDGVCWSGDGLADIMATNPTWATGLPLAAAGETMYRYAKG